MSKTLEQLTFEFVLQANLEALVEVCVLSDLTPEDCANDEQKLALVYGQILVHSLRGESVDLKRMLEGLPDILAGHAELREIDLACSLRLQILNSDFHVTIADQAIRVLRLNESHAAARKWRGELAMLVAMTMVALGEMHKAQEFFLIAKSAFIAVGFQKRALQAQTHTLVCEHAQKPSANLLMRFHDLYRKAIKRDVRDVTVATTCLIHISKQYQRAGAALAALKHCNRAIALFERHMGDVGYFKALAYRAELLMSLGRVAEARIDLEMASLTPFTVVPSVQPAAPVSSGFLVAGIGSVASLPVSKVVVAESAPQSAPKSANVAQAPKLSNLEEKLLSILSRGPRDRAELADEIYGLRLDSETKRNRFKSLIGTFRKKCPDLVIFDQGRYRIADSIFIAQTPHVS